MTKKARWYPHRTALWLAPSALLVFALLLQPWWLAPLVGWKLSRSANRVVHFESLYLTLSPRLRPLIRVRGANIANAAWASSAEPLARVREGSAEISWRGLMQRPLLISHLEINGGAVNLERKADGLRNWRLRKPLDRGPGRFRIQAVTAHEASLHLLLHAYALDMRVESEPNQGGKRTLPSRLQVSGSFQQIAFSGIAQAGETLTFFSTGRDFGLSAKLHSGDAQATFEGRIGDLMDNRRVDGRLHLSGSSLAAFGRVLGQRGAARRGFLLKGQIKGARHDYAVSGITARVGESDLSGSGRYAQDEKQTLIQADLRSQLASIDDLEWLAGNGQSPKMVLPAAPASTGPPMQGVLRYEARRLKMAAFPALQSLKLRATASGDVVSVSELELGLASGSSRGALEFDLRGNARKLKAELGFEGLAIEQLLPPGMAKARLGGLLSGSLSVQSAGSSVAALTRAASGSATVSVSNGLINKRLDAVMGLQGGKLLRSLVGGSDWLKLDCASLELVMAQGQARIRKLVIDSEHTHSIGTGSIDLAGRTFDLTLTPQARQRSLLVLDRSIRLHGPWQKPERSLVQRAQPEKQGCGR